MKSKLSIDLETRSSVVLKTAGIYKYVEASDFQIILFAYAFDDEPVTCIDLANGERIPNRVKLAITNASYVKTAWNALFEIVCLEKYFGTDLDVSQWQCTQIGATMIGLPASLAQAGMALNLDTTKDTAGKSLINLFCKPAKKKTGKNSIQGKLFLETPVYNSRFSHPEKWVNFKNYCKTDVEQERKIRDKIASSVEKAFTEEERFIWWVDHKINKRGVLVDQDFAKKCIKLAEEQKQRCMTEAIKLTKLANPNSTAQIKGWLEAAIGESIESLNKKYIPGIKEKAMDGITERVIELRQELSKSSVKKFDAIIKSVSANGRIKGLHRYFGAAKTGRWSSSMVQIHNLKKNDEEVNIHAAREIVRKYGIDELELAFAEGPQEILSQLIRTAFIAKPGHVLARSDFSSIEARITAWLAGEKWRMDIFKTHGRIYEASAAQMFKVPIESISYIDKKGKTVKGPNYGFRAKGKIGELALGFGGGLEALRRMGGEDMGLSDMEMTSIVRAWRKASPAIVKYWEEIEKCAIDAIKMKGKEIKHKSNVSFKVQQDILWLKLPSGRFIAYREPRIEDRFVVKLDKYKETLTYVGMIQDIQKLARISTYGGKLVENIVQGTARDLLANAIVNLHKAKFDIVLHVHDEIVPEIPEKNVASSVIKINKIMALQPEWAKGLPLKAITEIGKYYQK